MIHKHHIDLSQKKEIYIIQFLINISEESMNNNYLTSHVNLNIQYCPNCGKDIIINKIKFREVLYNVVYKKAVSKAMDLWKCKECEKTFLLPNLYKITSKYLNI